MRKGKRGFRRGNKMKYGKRGLKSRTRKIRKYKVSRGGIRL